MNYDKFFEQCDDYLDGIITPEDFLITVRTMKGRFLGSSPGISRAGAIQEILFQQVLGCLENLEQMAIKGAAADNESLGTEMDRLFGLLEGEKETISPGFTLMTADKSSTPKDLAVIAKYSRIFEESSIAGESESEEELVRKSSPLYPVVDFGRRFVSGLGGPVEFSRRLTEAGNEIESIRGLISPDSEDSQPLLYLLEDIESLLSEMSQMLKDKTEAGDFRNCLTELTELEKSLSGRISGLSRSTFENALEETARSLQSEIPADDLRTVNFMRIEKHVDQLISGEITKDDFRKFLGKNRDLTVGVLQDYNRAYLSPDEWTKEVAIGDTLLREGLQGWVEALEFMMADNTDDESLSAAMEILGEANANLVMVQHLSKKVEKQAEAQESINKKIWKKL